MGNLSKTKKKLLKQANKRSVRRRQDQQVAMELECRTREAAYSERPIAAYVRYICQERPDLILGWSYPKQPREGIPHLTIKNHAGDTMYIYGAPFRTCPDDITSVKMAREIPMACDIDIPTEDFSTPDMEVFTSGINKAMEALLNKGEIFIGCMGGIGRTGLAIAGLLKQHDNMIHQSVRPATAYRDHIREHVHPHAIETTHQLEFIESYLTK